MITTIRNEVEELLGPITDEEFEQARKLANERNNKNTLGWHIIDCCKAVKSIRKEKAAQNGAAKENIQTNHISDNGAFQALLSVINSAIQTLNNMGYGLRDTENPEYQISEVTYSAETDRIYTEWEEVK